MRKYAGDVQAAALRQRFHQRHGAVAFGIKPQTAHAGIYFHMAIHHAPGLGSLGGQLQGVFLAEQRLRDGITGQNGRRSGIGVAQHQYGPVNALPAQIQRFLQRGHPEPIGTFLLQQRGHRGRPVAVAIRLYYGKIAAPGRHIAAYAAVIVGKGGKIDLRPAAFIIHVGTSPVKIGIV